MRRFTLIALAIVAAALLIFILDEEVVAQFDAGRRRLTVEKALHDFGQVEEGEIVSASFIIFNGTDEPVRIESARSDRADTKCNCSARLLPPGEHAKLEATLDTASLRGKVVRNISLAVHDPDRRELSFTLSVTVEPLLAFIQPFVFVGQLPKGASYSGKIRLVGKLAAEKKPSELTVETSVRGIEAFIVSRAGPRQELEMHYVLLPELRAGSFEEMITVAAENPSASAQLQLIGQKLGDITVHPDRLHFFSTDHAGEPSQTIEFTSEKTFHITGIEDAGGSLEYELLMLEEGKRYRLDVRLRNRSQANILGLLKVHTDLAEQPLIDIPVIGGSR
ncbi:MAG: DUF1573 domain-containing protein [Candidatus Abyssobacteria bacterium SURF_5]|uniref:DUF1573 domain-containing protein n=1 Tax=Abyssobacteria bacterium (strain SURF_5) TaxID=2093360 RepID=A0A3A4N8C6_ABYX5|nr:MAG: DUF1573 domain-containing protein [Candidatus Abyssubacteria bacterium SURF_5]